VGVQKCASVTNFIILRLRLGNRVGVRVSTRVRVSIRVSTRFMISASGRSAILL